MAEPYFPQLTGVSMPEYREYGYECCPSVLAQIQVFYGRISVRIPDERGSQAVGK